MRRPRWLVAHLLAVSLVVAFINLGFWQLGRWQERKLNNQVLAARLAEEPLPLAQLLESAGPDFPSLDYRRAKTEGQFQPDHELLVRSQVQDGVAGFHVVTPLLLAEGSAILVNRGWVPLTMDTVPSPAAPPRGVVSVSGWLRMGEGRASPGAIPDNDDMVTRIEVALLEDRLPWDLLPLYLVAEGGALDRLPTPLARPDLDDEGPHLAYAVQWFAFTIIGVVGYFFLLRRAIKHPRRMPSPA
ncbi:MAG TPA: SURF1 family cytochrome oxidase biogenesis protein [Acidimicrobiia bacterium]|nr:SURF1 family cytochrome oxidase biogenesis protein [Acidimicrobiia bacterium]